MSFWLSAEASGIIATLAADLAPRARTILELGRQHNIQLSRRHVGVLIKSLVKIAQAEEKDGVGVTLLNL